MIGLHTNIDAATYHADKVHEQPTLSSSIAKIILRNTARHAWCAHARLNPEYKSRSDDKFDLGTVVHQLVLGKGAGYDIHCFDDWRTKDARTAKEVSRKNGRTPILEHQSERALKISDAIAPRLPASWNDGESEVVAVWDDIGGATCRAMFDRLTQDGWIWDVKTTDSGLSDAQIARTIASMDYDLSAGMYVRGLSQLRPYLTGRIRFVWLFVEVEPPFECRLIGADATTLTIGDRKAALAIEKWRRCMESGTWPGYPPEIATIGYPAWAESAWNEIEMTDDATLTWKPLDGGNPMARIARDLRMAG